MPLHPAQDRRRVLAIRPASRLTRSATVLVGAALVVTGSALPALAGATPTLPSSCAAVAASTPGAPDGDYRLMLAGARTMVYCAGMATPNPHAYLSLVSTGGNANYSGVIRSSSSDRTDFTRLRLVDRDAVVNGVTCQFDACIDINDGAFSTSSGGFMHYGFAEGDGPYGFGGIDLTGTPFAVVGAAFSLGGHMPPGSAPPSIKKQGVDLAGPGGNRGSTNS